MPTAVLMSLLQAAAGVLLFAQNHALPPATAQAVVNFGSRTVQLVTQASAPVNFSVAPNDSIFPNMADLLRAPYLDGPGHWSPLGPTVQIVQEDTSFGDLNNDGVDDAAVIVNRPTSAGVPGYYLAAMLNQGGIMFNIADLPLGSVLNVASHTVMSEAAYVNGTAYRLLGNTLYAQ